MAKKQASASTSTLIKPKIKRNGVHSKNKNARSKKSKNYNKKYKGQGR